MHDQVQQPVLPDSSLQVNDTTRVSQCRWSRHEQQKKGGKGARYLVGRSVGVVRGDEQRDGVKREEEDGRPLLGEEPLVLLFAIKKSINK